MALVGLLRRNPVCKICNCFDDSMLNEITLDILLHRRTHEEIISHYNPLLPSIVDPLNSSNINSHRRHSDPSLIAKEWLEKKGKPVEESDIAGKLYAERFKETVDKNSVLHSLYKLRINTIQYLRDLLDDKKKEYDELRRRPEEDYRAKTRIKVVENDIRSLIKEIDGIEKDIQSIIIQDLRVEKGPGHTFINQNIFNVMESNLKGFMNEFIPYLLYKVFPEDIEKGKEVVANMSGFMDKHLAPTIKQLNQTNSQIMRN